ncbi:SlyX family protein [Roseiconus nitratireducens]|uniref:SlyX family protein n=1 Tax=Roseiconus nitratireducens TaxID=2605748 RepID=A0A5M6DCE2_9BACT|nr:SlyX family protein [Roseiconus nitratireducens]KAA5545228.1 SlyX family protein [Roseiconus nitratireducens]
MSASRYSNHMKTDSEKIVDLQVQLAHLQRQYEVLNDVVTDQAGRLDRLRKQVQQWERVVESLKNDDQAPGDPLEEKPPHY